MKDNLKELFNCISSSIGYDIYCSIDDTADAVNLVGICLDKDEEYNECNIILYLDGYNDEGIYEEFEKYITEVKPYLRSMSSMTDDEKSELWFLLSEGRTNIELNSNGQLITRDNVELGFNYPFVCPQISSEYVDWLNAHHFDYRGLIEKGLAIEAPEDMYK